MYQYCLFDYDGCLGDTLAPWLNAVKITAAEYGLVLDEIQIKEQFGTLSSVRNHGLDEKLAPSYAAKVKERARSAVFAAGLYEGAYELIHHLHSEGKDLAIISSNALELNKILAKNGIHSFFKAVICGTDVKKKKPHPEGIEKALGLLRCMDKRQAVMIGDSEHDLGAARNAGIDSILFYPENSFLCRLEELAAYRPKHVVRSHAELERVLNVRAKQRA